MSDQDQGNNNSNNQPSTSTNLRTSIRTVNGTAHSQAGSSRATRSSQVQRAPEQATRNDHTYGEPGPSSSSNVPIAVRQTRRVLSRHQRNADELDQSGLELEDNGSVSTNVSNNRLLRLRSANLRAAPTLSSNFEALNGIRRTTRNRVMHNYFEDDNNDDIEENGPAAVRVAAQANQQNQQNQLQPNRQRSLRLTQAMADSDSDSYSEEDKTPLKLMATSSSKKSHEHNTRNGNINKAKRVLYSDDEQVMCDYRLNQFINLMILLCRLQDHLLADRRAT